MSKRGLQRADSGQCADPDSDGAKSRGLFGIGRKTWMLIAAALLLALLWYAGRIFLLAFAGILFGIFLGAVAQPVSRWTRLRYRWALLLVVCVLGALAATGVWRAQRAISRQADQVMTTLPTAIDKVRASVQEYEWGRRLLDGMRTQGSVIGPQAISGVTNMAYSFATFAVDVLVILFIGIYCAAEPRTYRQGLLRLLPTRHRARSEAVLNRTASDLRWWMLGTLCSMIVVGVLIGIGLTTLGIQAALFLALLAAAFELIPTLGPIVAAVPAILVALAQGPNQAIYVAMLYLGVQLVESYVIWPLIQRSAVHLPPALVIFSIVLLGTLAGVLGALVATPMLVVAIVFVRYFYLEEPLPKQAWENSMPTAPRTEAASRPV